MASAPSAELWELRHAHDRAKCIVLLHPLGLELRYLINGQPLIARVFDTWDGALHQSRAWRRGLEARGWRTLSSSAAEFRQSA